MSTKSAILTTFERNKGKVISGAKLAKTLNVSRTSVWKHIVELRKEGYEISACTNRGYCLSKYSDIISKEGINPYLYPPYSKISINTFKSLDSTNKKAKELAFTGSKHGTVVIAEQQTSGKGRLGRPFFSPSNSGIYMSMVLRPKLTVKDSVLITTAASVCICRAIEKTTGLKAKIKWINDIVMNNKKVAGILTEASSDFESGNIDYIILGIGINFKEPEDGFPEELQDIATSIFHKYDATISRNELCGEIINEILAMCDSLNFPHYIREYKKRSIVLNKDITYVRNGIPSKGKAIDIKNDGSLVVRRDNNYIVVLNSGEVSIRGVAYAK